MIRSDYSTNRWNYNVIVGKCLDFTTAYFQNSCNIEIDSVLDMEIVSLMKDGMIDDWDMFERLTEYTYKQRLHALAEHHPILMTECPWNTRLKREKLLELMFEKFNVPAMYICKNAVLAAYANGRSTAMVVDSGATHTSAVPVHDGYVITQGIVKSPLGGDFITMQCRQFFEEKDVELVPACLVASKGKQSVSDKCTQRIVVN